MSSHGVLCPGAQPGTELTARGGAGRSADLAKGQVLLAWAGKGWVPDPGKHGASSRVSAPALCSLGRADPRPPVPPC